VVFAEAACSYLFCGPPRLLSLFALFFRLTDAKTPLICNLLLLEANFFLISSCRAWPLDSAGHYGR
jgi:hypothetical protein